MEEDSANPNFEEEENFESELKAYHIEKEQFEDIKESKSDAVECPPQLQTEINEPHSPHTRTPIEIEPCQEFFQENEGGTIARRSICNEPRHDSPKNTDAVEDNLASLDEVSARVMQEAGHFESISTLLKGDQEPVDVSLEQRNDPHSSIEINEAVASEANERALSQSPLQALVGSENLIGHPTQVVDENSDHHTPQDAKIDVDLYKERDEGGVMSQVPAFSPAFAEFCTTDGNQLMESCQRETPMDEQDQIPQVIFEKNSNLAGVDQRVEDELSEQVSHGGNSDIFVDEPKKNVNLENFYNVHNMETEMASLAGLQNQKIQVNHPLESSSNEKESSTLFAFESRDKIPVDENDQVEANSSSCEMTQTSLGLDDAENNVNDMKIIPDDYDSMQNRLDENVSLLVEKSVEEDIQTFDDGGELPLSVETTSPLNSGQVLITDSNQDGIVMMEDSQKSPIEFSCLDQKSKIQDYKETHKESLQEPMNQEQGYNEIFCTEDQETEVENSGGILEESMKELLDEDQRCTNEGIPEDNMESLINQGQEHTDEINLIDNKETEIEKFEGVPHENVEDIINQKQDTLEIFYTEDQKTELESLRIPEDSMERLQEQESTDELKDSEGHRAEIENVSEIPEQNLEEVMHQEQESTYELRVTSQKNEIDGLEEITEQNMDVVTVSQNQECLDQASCTEEKENLEIIPKENMDGLINQEHKSCNEINAEDQITDIKSYTGRPKESTEGLANQEHKNADEVISTYQKTEIENVREIPEENTERPSDQELLISSSSLPICDNMIDNEYSHVPNDTLADTFNKREEKIAHTATQITLEDASRSDSQPNDARIDVLYKVKDEGSITNQVPTFSLTFADSFTRRTDNNDSMMESCQQKAPKDSMGDKITENSNLDPLSKLSSYDAGFEGNELDIKIESKSSILVDNTNIKMEDIPEQSFDIEAIKKEVFSNFPANNRNSLLELSKYDTDDESGKDDNSGDIKTHPTKNEGQPETGGNETQDQSLSVDDKTCQVAADASDSLAKLITDSEEEDEVISDQDCGSIINFSPQTTDEESSLDELHKREKIPSPNTSDDAKYQDDGQDSTTTCRGGELSSSKDSSNQEAVPLQPPNKFVQDDVCAESRESAKPLGTRLIQSSSEDVLATKDEKKWKRKEIVYDFDDQPNITDRLYTQVLGKDISHGSFSRVIIMGDSYVSRLASEWPKTSNLKPYFVWQNTLKMGDISKIMFANSFIRRKIKCLVIILPSLDELLIFKSLKCELLHSPIRFPFHAMKEKVVPFIIEKMKKLLVSFLKNEKFKNCTIVFGGYPHTNLTHTIQDALNYNEDEKCNCSHLIRSEQLSRVNAELKDTLNTLNKGIYNRGFSALYQFKHFRLPFTKIKYDKGRWKIADELFQDFFVKLHNHLQFCIWSDVSCQLILPPPIKDSQKGEGDNAFKSLEDASVFFIGNSWYKGVAKKWAFNSEIKPYIYTSQKLKIEDIETFIMSEIGEQEEALVLASIGVNEFVSYKNYPSCSNHETLVYPVMKDFITSRPIRFVSEMSLKLTTMLKRLAKLRKKCKVVFTTCYPISLSAYYKYLVKKHSSLHDISIGERMEYLDNHIVRHQAKRILSLVNRMVVSLNKVNGLHTCDIFALLLQLMEEGPFTYPQYVPHVSPSNAVIGRLTGLFQSYLDSINLLVKQNEVELFSPTKQLLSLEDDFFERGGIESDLEEDLSVDGDMKDLLITIKNTSPPVDEDSSYVKGKDPSKASSSKDEAPDTVKTSQSSDAHEQHVSDDESSRKFHPKIEQFVKSSRDSTKYAGYDDRRNWQDSKYGHFEKSSHGYRTSTDRSRYPRSHYENQKHYKDESNYHARSTSKFKSRSDHSPGQEYSYYNPSASHYSSYPKKKRRTRSRSRSWSPRHSRHSRGRRSHHRGHSSTGDSSSSRSRSRSPQRSRSSRSKKSGQSMGFESSVHEIALANLRQIHDRECVMYRNNPEAHPDYSRERRRWNDMMQERGCNPYSPMQFNEWRNFWQNKLEKIFEVAWEEKKRNCLALLPPSSSVSEKDEYRSRASSSISRSDSKRSRKRSPNYSKKSRKSKRYSSDSSPDRSSKSSKKSKKSRKDSRSISPSKDESLEAINELQKKIDSFMEKASVNFPPKSGQDFAADFSANLKPQSDFRSPSESIPLNVQLKELIRILSKMADKFGSLSLSIGELNQKVFAAINMGKSALDCVDEDAVILLGMINDKLDHMLSSSNFTLVQKAIHTEAKEKVCTFLENFKREKDPHFGLNIELIAQSTSGFEASRIISFIKNSLKYNQINNFTEDDLMKIYLAVKSSQINSRCKELPHHLQAGPSTSFPFPPPSRYPAAESSSHSSLDGRWAALGAPQPPKQGYFHPLTNLTSISKRDQVRRDFLQLPMSDKIKKFVNFAKLEFEEKSFLLSHLEDVEKMDKDLAASLRMLITSNRSS